MPALKTCCAPAMSFLWLRVRGACWNGLQPCGVLCELTRADGAMMRLPEVAAFAHEHDMIVLSVEDIASWRHAHGI